MVIVFNEWKGKGGVYSVAISPDGSRIGAGCEKDVVIVDADNGQKVLSLLQGRTFLTRSVAFSPDGRTLVSGSNDRTIRLWDTETGKITMQPLTEHIGAVFSVAYTPDGRLLVSGSVDGTIRLWDARTGQPAGPTIDTGASVWAMAVSPDGTKVAAGCYDKTIRTYDTATRTILFQSMGHIGTIYSVAFSPDGHRLASGSLDGSVRLWEGSMGRAIGSALEGHTEYVHSVSFSPDGRYIASGSNDTTIRMWDVDTGASRCDPLRGHTSYVWSVAFTPDGSRLVSGSLDGSIRIWDMKSYLALTEPVKLAKLMEAAEPEIDITAETSAQDIVSHLGTRGCVDLTNVLDWSTCTDIPVSSGGFGDIYKCTVAGSTEVAIKTMRLYASGDEQNRKALKRAAREIYTWSKLRHPNVQPLLGLVVFRRRIGMVATWEVNGNLSQYLEQHPEADRCLMCIQIADGLAYLHASAVVHGDLKGVNVLVSRDGRTQLTDFGSAVLDEYTLRFSRTSTKGNLTVRWASPELLRGGKCSQPADVYALGMTVLETLTGEVPWSDKSDMGVQFAVAIEKATPERPVAHIPVGSEHGDTLWSVLKSCWAYEADERPSAESVSNALRGITQEGLK